MDNYNTIEAILKSDLKWCLKHKNDQTGDKDDIQFNHGYCAGRISLIKDLLSEIEVLRMQEEIEHENR